MVHFFVGIKDYDEDNNAIVNLFYKDKKLYYLASGKYNFKHNSFLITVFQGKITKESVQMVINCLEKHDWDANIHTNLGHERNTIFFEKLRKIKK